MYSLNSIFNSITPDNIKDIPAIKNAMAIFTEVLEERSSISLDIANVFNEEVAPILKEELIKIYLNDIYNILYKVQTDKAVVDKINYLNGVYGSEYINKDFLEDLPKIINYEHFITTRAFKQKKGTFDAIDYVYEMISNLTSSVENELDLKLTELEPFNFEVEGSLQKELYDNIVRPLAHPLGFTYVYKQIVLALFEDAFNVRFTYKNVDLEVRCLSGEKEVYTDKVINIKDTKESDKTYRRIYFENGNMLEQRAFPIEVRLYDSEGNVLKDYTELSGSGHCSIYLDYDIEIEITTTDDIKFREDKYLEDSFNEEEGYIVTIGKNLTIGDFIINGIGRRNIADEIFNEVTFEATRPINGSESYYIYGNFGSIKVNEFVIEDDTSMPIQKIGEGYLEQVSDTTEYYDIRNVEEEFEISTF